METRLQIPSSFLLPSFLPPSSSIINSRAIVSGTSPLHRAIFRLGPFTIDRETLRVHQNLSFVSSRISSLSDRKQKLNIRYKRFPRKRLPWYYRTRSSLFPSDRNSLTRFFPSFSRKVSNTPFSFLPRLLPFED